VHWHCAVAVQNLAVVVVALFWVVVELQAWAYLECLVDLLLPWVLVT